MLTVSIASRFKEEDFTVDDLTEIEARWDSHLLKVIDALKLDKEIFIGPLTKCVQKVQTFQLFLKLFEIFLSSNVIGHLKKGESNRILEL